MAEEWVIYEQKENSNIAIEVSRLPKTVTMEQAKSFAKLRHDITSRPVTLIYKETQETVVDCWGTFTACDFTSGDVKFKLPKV